MIKTKARLTREKPLSSEKDKKVAEKPCTQSKIQNKNTK